MATPFDTLTVAAAQQALQSHAPTGGQAQRYAQGDHWQQGDGWIGPRPNATDAGVAEVLREIERAFISKNVIGEVLNRHCAGVVGQPIAWRVTLVRSLAEGETPTIDEQTRIDEAEAALTAWWDSAALAQIMPSALVLALCGGRAPLRLFVPPGLLLDTETGPRLPPGDVATQLQRIAIDVLDPATACVITDPATRARAGVFCYEDQRQSYAEVSVVDGAATVLRILNADGVVSEVRVPLDGRLLLHDLTRPPLITAQVMALQRLLNLALTMLGRNVVMGGFLERVLLNAQLPGEYCTDPRTGARVFVPQPLRFGAGSVNALMGAEIRDEATGQLTGYANPSVIYRDPVPVDTFAATRDIAYRAILEECQQAHALLSGEAAPSGESRRLALTDFVSSLRLSVPAIERATRWLLETALSLAAHFAGQSGRFTGLRAVVTCQLDAGPLHADDVRQAIDLVDARLLSRESAMVRIGIDDTDAETQRIQAEADATATIGQAAIDRFNSGG